MDIRTFNLQQVWEGVSWGPGPARESYTPACFCPLGKRDYIGLTSTEAESAKGFEEKPQANSAPLGRSVAIKPSLLQSEEGRNQATSGGNLRGTTQQQQERSWRVAHRQGLRRKHQHGARQRGETCSRTHLEPERLAVKGEEVDGVRNGELDDERADV